MSMNKISPDSPPQCLLDMKRALHLLNLDVMKDYGLFRGICVDAQDPEQATRVMGLLQTLFERYGYNIYTADMQDFSYVAMQCKTYPDFLTISAKWIEALTTIETHLLNNGFDFVVINQSFRAIFNRIPQIRMLRGRASPFILNVSDVFDLYFSSIGTVICEPEITYPVLADEAVNELRDTNTEEFYRYYFYHNYGQMISGRKSFFRYQNRVLVPTKDVPDDHLLNILHSGVSLMLTSFAYRMEKMVRQDHGPDKIEDNSIFKLTLPIEAYEIFENMDNSTKN